MKNVDVVILLITPKLREAVSLFWKLFVNNFFLQLFREYTLIWQPKTCFTHLYKPKTRALPWNISRFWSWECVNNYWIQLTLQKRKLFSRDIKKIHLWKLRKIFKGVPSVRSSTTIITIYTLHIYLRGCCRVAEKSPLLPKIHISGGARARARTRLIAIECLSWVDTSMVRNYLFLIFISIQDTVFLLSF